MSLTINDLDNVLNLAHLAIPDAQKETMLGQLNDLFAHIDTLKSLDVSNLEPSSWAHQSQSELRDDVAEQTKLPYIEDNAPDFSDGYFNVPKMQGE